MRNFENSSANRHDANATEQATDREKLKLERHQKKLIGYYLSGGDPNYIYKTDQDEYSERHITDDDKAQTLALIDGYPKLCRRLEHQLLEDIESFPPYGKQSDEILSSMSDDKHQKRILNYTLGHEWDDYDSLSSNDMNQFLKTYPTPLDFETDRDTFLRIIEEHNGEKKLQEYKQSMDDFCKTVYGKRYDYYKAIQGLHEEANHTNSRKQKLGRYAMGAYVGAHEISSPKTPDQDSSIDRPSSHLREPSRNTEPSASRERLANPERLVVDVGAITKSRGELTGSRKENEDAAFYNSQNGLFGVFDGMGGKPGGARASRLAAFAANKLTEQKMPQSTLDLRRLVIETNKLIQRDRSAGNVTGYTTAAVGKIIEDEDGKRLSYVSVGDSRIYIVRGEELIAVTKDEGYGRFVTNILGDEDSKVEQYGDEPLREGDRIVFCTDGITGDKKEQSIPDREFVKIVNEAKSAEDAAKALINRATKIDDRTAIVVEV